MNQSKDDWQAYDAYDPSFDGYYDNTEATDAAEDREAYRSYANDADEDAQPPYDDAEEDISDDSYADEETSDEDELSDDRIENDTLYFMELLNYLEDALEISTSVPLTGKRLVDTEKCQLIISDMRNNLADAIQYGDKIYQERERILSTAENNASSRVETAEARAKAILAEANDKALHIVESAKNQANTYWAEAEAKAKAMLEDAKEQAAQMIEDNEITIQAHRKAQELMDEARTRANERRVKAVDDCARLYTMLENQVLSVANELHRSRDKLTDTEN